MGRLLTIYPRRKTRGLTLIEVTIAAAISLMAATAVIYTFVASSKMSVEAFLRNKAYMEARIVIDSLTTDGRAAVGIESSFGTYTAGPDTLILKVPSVNAMGFPVDIDAKFDRIIYHKGTDNANELVRTVIADASSSRPAGDTVVGTSSRPQIAIEGTYSVQPDALGAYVIHYEFTSVQSRAGKDYIMPVAGSIRLRNRSVI